MTRPFTRTTTLLVALYVVLCALPLVLALIRPPEFARGFGVEFGVALGFLALSMMGLQFILSARFGPLSRRIGQDSLLQFHKYAGIAAAVFVFAHPAVLIIVQPAYASFFDPRVNFMRAAALSTACGALALLILLSVFRARLGISYEWWRLTHGGLASIVMLVGMAHVVMVGHYADPAPKAAAFVLLIGAPLAILAHMRLLHPRSVRKRPYRLAQVRNERDRVWTVEIEAHGHDSIPFEPGQFVWLTFADSPWSLRQHPFTIASSAANPARLEFTIKELGDFTSTIGRLPIGSTVFVDGPAGGFRLPADAPRAVLVAGGIGITPMLSILRSMHDRNDRRPVTLIYANQTLEKAALRHELDRLAQSLPLRIVHVLEHPPEHWTGPTGYVTPEVLDRALSTEDFASAVFMICGPDPMMNAVESALLDRTVSRDRIRSERFNVV